MTADERLGPRCDRSFDIETGEQIPNFVWGFRLSTVQGEDVWYRREATNAR